MEHAVCSVSLEGKTVTQRLSSGNRENYTKSTCSALPYPISVKYRIIAIQRAGTCSTSINRVVLQSIPRGSRELSLFYTWGNSGTGIKAKMFQPGCLLLGTYTHIYATYVAWFSQGQGNENFGLRDLFTHSLLVTTPRMEGWSLLPVLLLNH